MTFFLLDTFSFLISLLGFRGIRFVSHIIGFILFDVCCIRRQIILNNLNIVYGKTISAKRKKQIGRKCMTNFISTALEFVAAQYLLPKAKFHFKNKELADKIIHKNKGLYSICMHLGNWEYLCHINAKTYMPVHVVVKDLLSGNAEKWIKTLRHKLGYRLTDRTKKISSAQQIFQAIENKEIVGFIVDQKRRNGQMLPFFGKLASTNDGLAKLYFRKPAPLLCASITRVKPGEFLIEYFPFEYERNSNLSISENITEMTKQINTLIEPILYQNPEEYYWLHDRWKTKR